MSYKYLFARIMNLPEPQSQHLSDHLRTSEGRPDGELEGMSVGTSLGEEDGRREGYYWVAAMEEEKIERKMP